MNFNSENLEQYCIDNSSAESELLKKLNRDTFANVLRPRMLSGHLQGSLLSMISKMIRPKYILEIGTYTGYSALCMAAGLQGGGLIHTIDNNAELEVFARGYFAQSEYNDKINYIIGDAAVIIPKLKYTFDLVFIDADKENNQLYYDLVFNNVREGGFILADNVLWSGKVIEELKPSDKETRAILDFNAKIASDPRVEVMMLPFRDGLSIIRKKEEKKGK